MNQWRLKKGEDRRFKSGHPWVYSNELQSSPGSITAGQAVELSNPGGEFLALGAGNPKSLISFRAFSRVESDREDLFKPIFFERKIQKCLVMRKALGLGFGPKGASFRVCFGEADELSGCVIDAYRLVSGTPMAWVIVVQVHAAAIEAHLPALLEGLKSAWKKSGPTSQQKDPENEAYGILIRREMQVRALEGLEIVPPELVLESEYDENKGDLIKTSLKRTKIYVGELELEVNLWDGQKTGFYLDQANTIFQFIHLIQSWSRARASKEPISVLDLFSYVGQWSAAIAKQVELPLEITCADASKDALAFAATNVVKNSTVISGSSAAASTPARAPVRKVDTLCLDLLKEREQLPRKSFDIVISDPPALIKNKKAMEAGKHEYVQLHTEVLERVKPGGLVICCSCSFHLSREDFEKTLAQAEKRSKRRVYWLDSGGAAWDHPRMMAFPEGEYLKSRMGWVE